MHHRPKPRRRVGAAAVIEERPASTPGDGLVERPDGWYWVAPDGRQQFGPFDSAEAARANRDAPEPASDLAEAEEEIGIHSWIDPATGEPAEGPAPPHLDTEEGPVER